MNEIYNIVSKLSPKFKEMAFGICKDENEVNNAVQELMLYFLQMSPDVLRSIYEKDGSQGILKYGAVALRRALTSTRSAYYYKYKKYYTNLNILTYTDNNRTDARRISSIYNIPEEIRINQQWEKLEKIDKELDKLHWYDSKIFQLYYYEDYTLDRLAKETKISRNSLFTTIHKVKDILKEELADE